MAGDFETGVTAYVDSLTAPHAAGGHRGRIPHSPLPRPATCTTIRLRALLRLPQPVRLLDDDAGAGRQLPSALRLLGGGRLCSYLLIGFWYTRASAARPARRRSSSTASATSASCSALMWLWTALGTSGLRRRSSRARRRSTPATATGIALLALPGRVRQVGPAAAATSGCPTRWRGRRRSSALIHAATMVTAGVYMVARSHALFERSGTALERGRLVGRYHRDLRGDHRPGPDRHQAGAGLLDGEPARLHVRRRSGWARYVAGIFHLVTHAFFKALLFLGAGSVIHGLRGEQDLRKMGGLALARCRSRATTMWIGASRPAPACRRWRASSRRTRSWPPRSTGKHTPIFILLVVGAFLTAFYTFRLLFLAFSGSPRMSKEVPHHAHESPRVDDRAARRASLSRRWWPASSRAARHRRHAHRASARRGASPRGRGAAHWRSWCCCRWSWSWPASGWRCTATGSTPVKPDRSAARAPPVHALLINAYYVDWIYDRLIVQPLYRAVRRAGARGRPRDHRRHRQRGRAAW